MFFYASVKSTIERMHQNNALCYDDDALKENS